MKVLFIVFNDYLAKNGISVVTQYLAEGLVKKGHSVKVYTAIRKETKPNSYNGVSIESFSIRYNRFKKPVGEIDRFKNMVAEDNSDVIIVVSLQTPTADCLFDVLENKKAKIVLHTHDFEGLYLTSIKWKGDLFHTLGNTVNYFTWNKYYKYFVPRHINTFDMIISLTKYNKDVQYLERYYCGKNVIIGNAAEDVFFDDKAGKEPYISGKYFISVANYNHVKNQLYILSEYYKSEAGRDYAMCFCGSSTNKYVERLKRLKRKLDKKYGEREVQFLYGIERKYIPNLIKNATLYLCGSRWEAYSISLIEAMALGTPFISLDVGNARELPGGITVNNKSFSRTMDKLCADSKLLNDIAMAGKEFAKHNCRIDQAVEKLEKSLISLFECGNQDEKSINI
ncbi:glycosyltransferase family 1 protein [Butyrivibrio sp. XB500-5]|uniref:glycosyltransferase family 4 protein n=1 Tax=Butyrivibrio sp. XB500-5 TaxID=2364880 RepID=UPI000EA9E58F|nr:glycosyltransferase family 4 protein [Butyrivibrio sp. XB500-5]RKM60699.1 glycosyltransferase family 1 protein [Butyrivibrio sp. XB500-5]